VAHARGHGFDRDRGLAERLDLEADARAGFAESLARATSSSSAGDASRVVGNSSRCTLASRSPAR